MRISIRPIRVEYRLQPEFARQSRLRSVLQPSIEFGLGANVVSIETENVRDARAIADVSRKE
jgi:hypothetical protein